MLRNVLALPRSESCSSQCFHPERKFACDHFRIIRRTSLTTLSVRSTSTLESSASIGAAERDRILTPSNAARCVSNCALSGL